MSQCPFKPCNKRLTPVVEQKHPGGSEMQHRLPMHEIGGHETFGLCPASLMLTPLNDDAKLILSEQARIIERMIEEQGPPPASSPDHGQPPTGRLPIKGGGDPYWFTQHRKPLGALPRKPAASGAGSSTPTVADVRAALSVAKEMIEAALQGVELSKDAFATVLQILNQVRESSTDQMGAPQVSDIIEKCDEIKTMSLLAIEKITTYEGNL